MKMKRLIALALMIVLVVSMVVGCSTDSGSDSTAKPEEKKEEKAEKAESTDESAALPYEGVTLTLMIDQNNLTEGVDEIAAIAKEELGISIEYDRYVGGAEGDNLVKTRLASGEMTDMLLYNSGSLLGALNPGDYLLDISGEPFMDRVSESFKTTVRVDGMEFGIPYTTIMAGGIMYNKAIYKELGLELPKTWDEFMSNCEAIKAAGKTAVIGTYGDSWTSQVTFLGDNYNVLAENPNFAEKFEAGTAKFASTPAGVESFQKLADIEPYLNGDYSVATFSEGVDMLATGEGAHWPMLSMIMTNIGELYPEAVEDIGVFGVPGDDSDNHGLTVWMPNAMYINKNSENVEAAKAFFEIYVSDRGLDAFSAVRQPVGAYVIEGYELPDNAMTIVKEDMQAYVNSGKTGPALEYLTAVKGPNCPAICQGVGSAQITAAEAAESYDADCLKQAIQLGLDW